MPEDVNLPSNALCHTLSNAFKIYRALINGLPWLHNEVDHRELT